MKVPWPEKRRQRHKYSDALELIERSKIASCDTDWSSLKANEPITDRRPDNGIIKLRDK